jgi:hypothetical protein
MTWEVTSLQNQSPLTQNQGPINASRLFAFPVSYSRRGDEFTDLGPLR